MKQINRWILSCQNRVANIWYNQDYTVYGLNPSAGPQPPNNSNTVTVYDVVGFDNTPGVIALQCTGNPGAGIPTAYANMCPPLSYHVMFQDPNGGWFQGFTSLQPVPTGDGYFALYVPWEQRYVAIDPNPDPAASNCNVLFGLDDDISHAARFTATGLDRPSALDVLDAQATGGKNASGMIFRGISLGGRDLSGWNLSGCDFRGASSLSGCKMAGANLQRARFAGLHLGGLTLSGADCTGADFTGCDFTGISPGTPPPVLAGANLTGAVVPGGMSFSGAKMAGAVLAQAAVTTTDLSGADLAGANFDGQGVSYFTPVWTYPSPFDLNNPADRVIAYDYASSGKLDHLVCYRPGTGMVWIMQRNADGTFAQVYGQHGIGGYDLADPGDQIIAYDYDGTGRLDHLVCYRPAHGYVYILKKVRDTDSTDAFTPVYHQQGIGGWDMHGFNDRVVAYDYDGTGHPDHLVCYRPGHGDGAIYIVKKVSEADDPTAFTWVYSQGDPGGRGIGGCDLQDTADRVVAYDYDGTGRLDHLVCYRPGSGMVWILKKVSDANDPSAFTPVYQGSGIGGYSLTDPADQIIAYDYAGTGHLDHLVCYRPGSFTGLISILKKVSNNNSPDAFTPVYQGGGLGSGLGGYYDLAVGADRIITCDFDGTGKPGYLACYRPGGNVIWIIQKKAAGPARLVECHLDRATLSGVSLAGFDLTTVTLAGAKLPGGSLAGAELRYRADLTGADLSRASLAGAKFLMLDLTGTDLAGTDFTGLDLTGVRFPSPLTRSTDPDHLTIFRKCTLPYAVIGKDWSWLDLTDTTITGAPSNLTALNAQGVQRPRGNFSKLTLDGANFAGANLTGANFSGASLQEKASFAGAKMSGAFFIQAVLDQADFTGATLDGAERTEAANFSYAYLSNCDFNGAGLFGAIFTGATLIELTLAGSGVNLQQADFSDAYLPNSDFTQASLQGAKFDGAFMVECDLTNADLTPAGAGTLQASLAAACLQGATLTGTKLSAANLPEAAITNADGQITVQYWDEDGSLTEAYAMPYTGAGYPDPSSLSDTTVCPNTITYEENLANRLTIAQMMIAPNPPAQWKPRNTMEDRNRLAAAVTSGAAAAPGPPPPGTPR